MYYVLALCLYCYYSLFSFLVMFYSYYIDVQLSHLNYLLTLARCEARLTVSSHVTVRLLQKNMSPAKTTPSIHP